METIRITDRWLRALKPSQNRLEFADSICPGLRIRIGKRAISWSVLVRIGSARRRIGLGSYPETGLAEARLGAETAREQAQADAHSKPGTDRRRKGTLKDLLKLAIEEMEIEGKGATGQYRAYLLEGTDNAAAVMGADRPACEITPADVTAWLRRIHNRGTETRHPRAYLSAAFARGMKADYDPTSAAPEIRFGINQNPVQSVGGGGASGTRDRHLSLGELQIFWREFGGQRVRPQTRLLLRLIVAMGGVRITEIVRSRKEWWKMTDGRLWLHLPKTKNNQPHALPVPLSAVRIHSFAEELSDHASPYLFPSPTDPSKPQSLSSISQAVRRWCDANEFEPFQPRDLRRTMKTLYIDTYHELPREWVDVWHNHGMASDVARKHYDRAQYLEAKIKVAAAFDGILAKLLK